MTEERPKTKKDKIKSGLRRAMWLFMAILFIVTGLGVGVYAFIQATHQKPPCDTTSVQNAATLANPLAFKPTRDVTKLQTVDIQKGTGREVESGDCVTVKYYGTIANTGQKFDENFDTPTAFQFQFGQGAVIPGWDLGLKGMKMGGIRRLVIPSDLAYGANGSCQAYSSDGQTCQAYTIEPNADLVFMVKLLDIK